MSVEEILDEIAGSKRATLDRILADLARMLKRVWMPSVSRTTDARSRLSSSASSVRITRARPPKRLEGNSRCRTARTRPLRFGRTTPPAPTPVKSGEPDPILASTASPSRVGPGVRSDTLLVGVEVEPRKPRLAWQGMDRREAAVSVPTQVVEIVRPGREARRGEGTCPGLDARRVGAREQTTLPPNRLIWTNDNLVALQTLLDERDPETRDYRYRGKVDLVYIDSALHGQQRLLCRQLNRHRPGR